MPTPCSSPWSRCSRWFRSLRKRTISRISTMHSTPRAAVTSASSTSNASINARNTKLITSSISRPTSCPAPTLATWSIKLHPRPEIAGVAVREEPHRQPQQPPQIALGLARRQPYHQLAQRPQLQPGQHVDQPAHCRHGSDQHAIPAGLARRPGRDRRRSTATTAPPAPAPRAAARTAPRRPGSPGTHSATATAAAGSPVACRPAETPFRARRSALPP